MIRKIVFLSSLFSVLSLILCPIAEAQTHSSTQTQPPTQQAPPQIAPAPAPAVRGTGSPGSDDDLSYRIGPGDELDIRVFGRAELSRTTRVDNYGKIRLPFLQEMQAACLTEAQLAGQVAEKYKKFLREPQVDVLVKEYRSQPVAVIGAVNQPGRFQLQRRARALELITFAGGPKTTAVGGVVHIIHNGELDHCAQTVARNQPENGENGAPVSPPITSIKLSEMMAGTADSNPFVQPGDVISVPEADQIFVTGFVVRPGPFPMTPGLTLTQAVALAGGVNPEGSVGRVRLVRGTPGKGERKETVYNLHDIHKRKIQDVALNVNDIVEIPSSTSRIAYRGALGVGINLLNSLPFFILR
jgi:polysaccharide biosynthesis/export protein